MPDSYIPLAPGMKVAGRVAAIPKGVWNSESSYKKLDIVTWDYKAYMAKKSSTNHMPIGEDDDYWMLLVESFINDFVGATSTDDGHAGMVPKPYAGEEHKVLRGDGDWGPKLEMDIIQQGDLYGYINNLGDFVAFQSQQDVINIITNLLIPEDAQESLDTLKEIADWIQNHPDDAAAMNTRITELEENTYKKSGGTISGDVLITGDLTVRGEVEFDNPLEIESGGTGANNAHDARVNLNVLNNENVAPVEDDEIANRVYNEGDHFIYDDKLYLVLSAIETGDTIRILDESSDPNVIIIDQVDIEDNGAIIPSNTSSDDSSYASSDDEDPEPTPGSGIHIRTTSTSVIFSGTGNGSEYVFPICSNLLDNPLVKHDKPYCFSEDSKWIDGDIQIVPKFMLYDADDLVDMVASFNLEDYPDVDVVKAVYIYRILGEIDLVLKPAVYTTDGFYNCTLSDNVEDQLKELKSHGIVMTGATDTEDGGAGYVPAPVKGENHKFFKGDGSYDVVNLEDEIEGVLAVENGGTGADNSYDAVNNLNAVPADMIAPKEQSLIASRPYAINNQLIINNTLYTVTKVIYTGDKFEEGVNITPSDNIIRQIKTISAVSTTFEGATAEEDGFLGLVPGPLAGEQEKVLKGNGTWEKISSNFVGTMAEWEALSLNEKLKFETADIIPEYTLSIYREFIYEEEEDEVDPMALYVSPWYGTEERLDDEWIDYIIEDDSVYIGDDTNAVNLLYYDADAAGSWYHSKFGYGRIVTVTPVLPPNHWYYKVLSGAGQYIIDKDIDLTIKLQMRETYVTLNTDSHILTASISPEPEADGKYKPFTELTVSATAEEHYHVTSKTTYNLNNVDVAWNDENIVIDVTSAMDTFTVTVNSDEGIESVRLSPSATNNIYEYGTVVTAIVTTKPGYDLISGSGQYTITEDTTVTVVSEIQHYTLTTSGDEHVAAINISPSPDPDTGKYDYGTVVTITATADEHYHITSGTGNYTITADTTIDITAAIDQFTVTVNKDLGTDTVSLSPVSEGNIYDYGTVVTVSATPLTGYDIISGTGEYTITEDTTVNVASQIQTFTVTVTQDANVDTVTLSPTPVEGKYDYGTVVTVSAAPLTGYDIISGTGEYTITADTTIDIVSDIQHIDFTLIQDEHVDSVILSPEPVNGKYDYGTVVTVSATPVTGYDIVAGTGTYTITEATTVRVLTEIQTFTVTVTQDSNVDTVTLSPTPVEGKYDYGTVVTVSATPVTGYEIESGTGEYTITADITINVTAHIIRHTFTVTQDANVDTVTLLPQPFEDGKYEYGTTVTVTATAIKGYEIASGTGTYTVTADTVVNIASQLAPVEFASDGAFTLAVAEPGWDGIIEYTTDGGETWTEWDGTSLSGTASDSISLRGSGNTKLYDGAYDNRLIFTGKYCYGSIEMLLDYEDVLAGTHPTMATGCFHSIFEGCTSLVLAPMLPATTLVEDCYYSMFSGCTSLATAPELPATVMADYCYAYMFNNCTSLTVSPALPSTTLAEGCYDSMFINCTALHTLPVLPATTLAEDCYEEMFLNCTSVKLSKTDDGEYQYEYRIPASSTGTNIGSLRRMFYNTGGSFTGTPVINIMYYTTHEPVTA